MNAPFGDHTGLDDTESTRRTGAPPFIGTRKTRTPCVSAAATASAVPSGDHDGVPRTSSEPAIARAFDPSAAMQYNVERLGRRTDAQIVPPSGDVAAPTNAPSVGFHTSLVARPLYRHTASAPPRDAR